MKEQDHEDKYSHLPKLEICGDSTDGLPVYKVYSGDNELLLRCPECSEILRYEKQEYVKGDTFRTILNCTCGRAEKCYLHNVGSLPVLEKE